MLYLRHLAEKKIILHALMPSQSANIECLRAKNIKKINIVKKSEKKLKVCCWPNFNLNMLHQNNKVRRPYVTNTRNALNAIRYKEFYI